MEYSTYLIAKSLVEEMSKIESQIKLHQNLVDNADECTKGTEDEKVILDFIHEMHCELAELKVEFMNL